MKKLTVILLTALFSLASAGQLVYASGHGGKGKNEKQRVESEKGKAKGHIKHERKRMEKELKKKERKQKKEMEKKKKSGEEKGVKAQKSEEHRKNIGKGSETGQQARQKEKKWWQFWK